MSKKRKILTSSSSNINVVEDHSERRRRRIKECGLFYFHILSAIGTPATQAPSLDKIS